jgi:hypothetical protein
LTAGFTEAVCGADEEDGVGGVGGVMDVEQEVVVAAVEDLESEAEGIAEDEDEDEEH